MMIKRLPLVSAGAVVALMAVTTAGASAQEGAREAFAPLMDLNGAEVGLVTWSQTQNIVTVEVDVEGLPPGSHGFHVHAVGECIPPFTSAGPHFDPGGTMHPDHAGDMPSLLVNADGSGSASFTMDRYAVNDLFGAGVIIHAGADNFANIPDRYVSPEASVAPDAEAVMVAGPDAATLASGDAGDRIACGMIAIPKPAQ